MIPEPIGQFEIGAMLRDRRSLMRNPSHAVTFEDCENPRRQVTAKRDCKRVPQRVLQALWGKAVTTNRGQHQMRKSQRASERLQRALARIEAVADIIDRINKQTDAHPALTGALPLEQLHDAVDDARAALIDLREGMAAL